MAAAKIFRPAPKIYLCHYSQTPAALSYTPTTLPPSLHMFARINQLARHLSHPLPNYAHTSAALSPVRAIAGIMTSNGAIPSPSEKSKRMIHTAGCLIIGDEVLGGKVRVFGSFQLLFLSWRRQLTRPDCRYEFCIFRKVLLQFGYCIKEDRGNWRR